MLTAMRSTVAMTTRMLAGNSYFENIVLKSDTDIH